MPAWLFGSAYADVRLWPIFFIVGLTALVPRTAHWRGASVIAGAAPRQVPPHTVPSSLMR